MTNNPDFLPIYLSELSRQTGAMTLLVTITIGVVALIFAIGVFLVWRENKSVLDQANAHIKLIESKRQEIDGWYDEKKSSLDAYLKNEIDKFNLQIEEMRCYQTLIMALEHTGTHAAIMYPALCFLAERPCALYVGVFREVINRKITQDITERAEMGLKKWQEIQDKKKSPKK